MSGEEIGLGNIGAGGISWIGRRSRCRGMAATEREGRKEEDEEQRENYKNPKGFFSKFDLCLRCLLKKQKS
ncbi:hypothetical protein EUGRSUZ_C04196 [Eucalyptus grandis]|uniref:Uncharacterized protein n=2 Tax=Eucalyptus grandis TaxID=71139 RepID=A0ACC3LJW9_EUCGR|nr:hypothetical protein EUGRSUZ_C04196 [Eucalyptus grandis]